MIDVPHSHNGGPMLIDVHPDDRMRYAPLHIRDYLNGVRDLKPDQTGIYSIIFALIYDQMGQLKDDDHFIAAHCNVGVRSYRKARDILIEKGKIFVVDGYIYNKRAMAEIAKFCAMTRAKRDAALAREQRKRESAQTGQERAAACTPDARRAHDVRTPDARRAPTGRTSCTENYEIDNEINEGATTAVAPLPGDKDKDKDYSPIAPLTVEPGFEHVGGGVLVNCETVKHPGFTISLPAIAMQLVTANIMKPRPEVERIARESAIAHALQWAAEINAGRSPRSVVPSHVANFIRGSIVAQLRRGGPVEATAKDQAREAELKRMHAMAGRPS